MKTETEFYKESMAWAMTFNSVPRARPMVGASKTLENVMYLLYLFQCACVCVYGVL